jgi:RimJ/RimL family protein N-acetyltransferase
VTLRADGFRLRRAVETDLPYLLALAARSEVADFLAAVSPWSEEDLRAALAADPKEQGRFVLEVDEEGEWRPAGGLAFSVANRRSRIAYLFGIMVDPARRGQGLAERSSRLLAEHLMRELGYHRVQLEVYGFNERALRVFERSGFVREGTRRKAYWRHGAWHDGVLFGLVVEDLEG